ncbi:acyltransferase [Butyricimonas paravirosa]|uniref:acyltransferase n=1 Tax=Butyricimonas paravirosa TaxID=1472417 RepID=UPI0022E613D6|nr:acyltransferase [Butyricimonas paravirosa]
MAFITKILLKLLPQLVTSKMAIKFYRSKGIIIGKGTFLFNAGSITIDISRPLLLEIGEYCKITSGVIILTHDYSRSVLRRVFGEVIGEARKTIIGDNVFIGMNSIVLMGTHIGSNCIIGAGSVLHGVIPENSVVAGNPARVLCSLDEYYQKRKNKSVEEAYFYANLLSSNGKPPTIEQMGAFFPLYLERNRFSLISNNIRTSLSGDDEEDVINQFVDSQPIFSSFEHFLSVAKLHRNVK